LISAGALLQVTRRRVVCKVTEIDPVLAKQQQLKMCRSQ
jgi:hypothetical protein